MLFRSPDKNHAEHALDAALDMQHALTGLNVKFEKRGWAEIKIGIGLNSGVMSVGDMGSKFRRNYTVLGDAVNLGSRIEGLTKYYGVKILVSEFTQKNQDTKFLFRQVDKVKVKGKKLGIGIYEVICRKSEAGTELLNEIEKNNLALEHYFNKNFVESEHLFSELHKTFPDRLIYSLYLERIAAFKINPPPSDWDGVYVHVSK